MSMHADERMTSSDAAAALGLEGTSRLKQKVELAVAAAHGLSVAIASLMQR